MPDAAEIRQMMPGVLDTVYLNTGTCGPMPTIVHEAMVDELRKDLTKARITSEHFTHLFDLWGETREAVASVIGADPEEIAVTNRTTDGMYIPIMGFPWQPGEELIISNIEHPGGLLPAFLAKKRFGVRVKVADIGLGGGDKQHVVETFEQLITHRTRMIAISHVSYTTGATLPVKEIVEMAHTHDVLVVVDAAQSFGAFPVDVHDLGVDFFACPGQKWMCGPDGTGALYVRADRLGEIEQNHGGMLEWESLDYHGRTYQPARNASRFDTGGWNLGLLAGQIASTTWVRDTVGLDWAYERIARLTSDTYDQLQEIEGVTLVTPREAMAGLVTFTLEGFDPADLSERLAEDHNVTIRHVTKYINNPDAARVSVGFYNDESDIERLIDGIENLKAARPSVE
ncbi:MAG: aminotransferase class V-fold PLP-dependent enzyme [Chloroflexota bacterium]